MLIWTLQTTIISIVLIFLVHHLIVFFKTTLTVPKVKDLVTAPMKNYENIYNTIALNKNKNKNQDISSYVPLTNDYLNITVSKDEMKLELDSMKNELKSFLKNKISENGKNTSTEQYI
jgi:hypothetical protein